MTDLFVGSFSGLVVCVTVGELAKMVDGSYAVELIKSGRLRVYKIDKEDEWEVLEGGVTGEEVRAMVRKGYKVLVSSGQWQVSAKPRNF